MPRYQELTAAEWEALKLDIEHWYLREGKPLRAIVVELKNRGCIVKFVDCGHTRYSS